MKKINKIISALASLTVAVAALTGCPTSFPDSEAVGELGAIYLLGSMNDWTADDSNKLVAGDAIGFYSVTWQAKGESETWKFANSGWTIQYCQDKKNASYTTAIAGVTIDSVDDNNGGKNDRVSGLKTNSWYKFGIVASPTNLSVTLTEATAPAGSASSTPVPFHLDGFFISGSMNDGAADLNSVLSDPTIDTKTGYATYSYDFTFDSSNNINWGQNTASEVFFGIRNATSAWKVKYTNGTFSVGTDTDYVETEKGSNTNNLIKGLEDGKSYRIYVQTTPNKVVSFKVVTLNSLTVTCNISGLPEDAYNKTMYLTGGYNGWEQPGENKTEKRVYPVTISNSGSGTINFDISYEGSEYSEEYEVKIASADWNKPEITGDTKDNDGHGQNAKFTITETKHTVSITYKETVTISGNANEKENGDQYLCTWEVK